MTQTADSKFLAVVKLSGKLLLVGKVSQKRPSELEGGNWTRRPTCPTSSSEKLGQHLGPENRFDMFVFQALMSLFVLASRDGWVNIMYTGLDAVGVDQQVQSSS